MSSSEPPEQRLTAAEAVAQIRGMSGADWARAFSLARLRAAGLVGWTSEALLSEALVKLSSGERVWRRGVPPVVTLSLVMRSIASNIRKKEKNGPIDQYAAVDVDNDEPDDDEAPRGAVAVDNRTPYDIVEGRSQLACVEKLADGDEDVQLVLEAWADGLRGKDAAAELGFDMKRYDAARKRLNNRLEPMANARKES